MNKFINRHRQTIGTALILLGFVFVVTMVFFIKSTTVLAADASVGTGQVDIWSDQYSQDQVGFTSFEDIGMGKRDPRRIIAAAINVMLGFMGVVATCFIIYGGWLWMNAKGNEAQIEKARTLLKNSIIGLLIILSAFALAIYITRVLLGITDGKSAGVGNSFSGNNFSGSSGASALGGGIIKSVYPAPNQTDVPRNTGILVTFKEAIDPATICDKVSGGKCDTDAKILTDNIKIFANDSQLNKVSGISKQLGSTSSIELVDAFVKSIDNYTYLFKPVEVIGLPTDNVWYSVEMTKNIKKHNAKDAFTKGNFSWKFEVSSKIDLTPPKVTDLIFPYPDNSQDTVGSIEPAKAASASFVLKEIPQAASVNRVSYVKLNPSASEINIANPDTNTCSGQMDISINNTSPYTANIDYNNMAGKVNEPNKAIVDRFIETACGFNVEIDPGFQAGHAWRLDLSAKRSSDFLTVGLIKYTFVTNNPAESEIAIGSTLEETVAAIATKLRFNQMVNVYLEANNKIKLIAKTPGEAGNKLILSSNLDSSAIVIDDFSGGADENKKMNINDKQDQPKNAIIQINFNESIDPAFVSGSSEDVKDVIRVIDKKTNTRIAGNFIVSNDFKTVEFIPKEECGVNGCGETVYCLPGESEIVVELVAARLTASCTGAADCGPRSPFDVCQTNICVDKDGVKYPEGQSGSGITDLAKNSLDGNANSQAEGPGDWFNANLPTLKRGDNFRWSFWTSANLDITPPAIVEVKPELNAAGVGLYDPVTIEFNKLMLSNSLTTGEVTIKKGDKEVKHQLVNLWSLDNSILAYWVSKNDLATGQTGSQLPDRSIAVIGHSPFKDASLFKAQVGSGVKDIYQNCFKPCAGVACNADVINSSCCAGNPSKTTNDGKCP
ncbi:MAG: hypothetical protein PHR00_02870 [Patescibacteria group bacterium]|nr:hypothetical protein [Patescibacteria group bacterium]